MKLVHMQGGLGNQMFQYAFGKAIQAQLDVGLFFITDDYDKYQVHNGFELNKIFNLNLPIATKTILKSEFGVIGNLNLLRFLIKLKIRKIFNLRIYVERSIEFKHNLFNNEKCYLIGYWQSEKYFKGIVDEIRKGFKFAIHLNETNSKLSEEIARCNAISLHVRRGDYKGSKISPSIHSLQDSEYYNSAIDLICKKQASPVFFVFSDDINWAKENIRFPGKHFFIEHNIGADSYIDMQLMSLCKHHIIANSSFSWWGAWLNDRIEKTVIAPKKWFVDGRSIKDLLPDNWIQL